MRKIEFIIIHHSASPDEPRLDKEVIRDWHMTGNGWRDIGYHFIVEYLEGHPVILLGRPVEQAGAHCPPYNQNSIGLCMIGNFEDAPPPRDKRLEMGRLVRSLQVQYGIPRERVLAHREAMPGHTVCPGAYLDMEKFRQEQCLP